MIRGYKVRLYPKKDQEILMWKHIDGCRFIWNYMLDLQEKRFKAGEPHLSAFDMIRLLTPLKREEEYKWLNEISSTSMQVVCSDLHKAYQRFYDRIASLPKFKSKRYAKPNFPICTNALYFMGRHANIEKIGKVRFTTDQNIPKGKKGVYKFMNARIIREDDKWYLTFGMEIEDETPTLNDFSMGIDLGVKEQAVVAYGDNSLVFHNINKSAKMRRLEKQLKFHQRKVSRKYECVKKATGKYTKTKNIIKEEKIIKRIYKKMCDIRLNYIHQITHKLVSLLPKRVVMEDLNVKGMMSNRHLAKAIGEQNFYEFIRQMKYKCEWNGIEFVQVDRFYASSKTCCCCGQINRNLKLSDRVYKCECGNVIDRDLNAAINLMRYEA